MDQIPIVDISGSRADLDLARELVDAAATCGFVFVKNEGKYIPVKNIDDAFALSRKFFASPIEEKEACKISDNNRGWAGMHTENLGGKENRLGDFKEVLNLGEFVKGKAQQPLPVALQPHEADLNNFHSLCHDLCMKILDLFATGLEIDPPTWFSSRHRNGPSGTTLRFLYYPSLAKSASSPAFNTQPTTATKPPPLDPKRDTRAGAHSDYGSVTLLFQRPGQPGLEIQPPSSDSTIPKWVPVPVQPPTTEDDPSPPILVNIGDLLSYWTNGLFKSTVHRVVFPETSMDDRYSMTYFCHPVGATVLEPVPSKRVQALGESYGRQDKDVKAMTADEHLMSRLKATYVGLYKDE